MSTPESTPSWTDEYQISRSRASRTGHSRSTLHSSIFTSLDSVSSSLVLSSAFWSSLGSHTVS